MLGTRAIHFGVQVEAKQERLSPQRCSTHSEKKKRLKKKGKNDGSQAIAVKFSPSGVESLS